MALNRDGTETLVVYEINAVFDKDGVHLEEERMLGIWRDVEHEREMEEYQSTDHKREASPILEYVQKFMTNDL